MKRLLTSRATPAVVVAMLMALSAGGGYALASGGGTIRACVHNGTHVLYAGKCRRGDKKLSWGKTGPRGLQGPQGMTGAPGQTGPAGPLTLTRLAGIASSCPANTDCGRSSPPCPSGQVPISGEVFAPPLVFVEASHDSTANVWFAVVRNTTGSPVSVTIGVICSSYTSATGFSS